MFYCTFVPCNRFIATHSCHCNVVAKYWLHRFIACNRFIAMHLCRCNVVAMLLHCYCNVVALYLQCCCIVITASFDWSKFQWNSCNVALQSLHSFIALRRVCVTWLLHVCAMTHSRGCHDAFIYFMLFVFKHEFQWQQNIWHSAFCGYVCVCVGVRTWLFVFGCDMTHPPMWHASVCGMPHSCVSQDAIYLCVWPWRFYFGWMKNLFWIYFAFLK